MKTYLSIITCLLITINLSAQSNIDDLLEKNIKKYPIEKAIVKYEVSGDATGSANRTFLDFGWREHFVTDIKIAKYGTTDIATTTTLSLGDYSFVVKNDEQEGNKKKDSRLSELLSYKSSRESIDAIMMADGATKSGTAMILNKECTKWIFATGYTKEIYEWNGLILKIVKTLPGIAYEIVAMEINEEAEISEAKFEIPALISFEE